MPSAVVYARVSTKSQEEKGASLESQVEACREYAAANGYTILREVKEQFSGSYLFDRPLLNEIREEIRADIYDALIVFDIDRLSRSLPHLGILFDECERFNTQLLFVKGDFERTPEGMLFLSIRGYQAETEKIKIVERLTRGRRAKAKSGTLSFKRKLFGYELDEKGKRRISESEAETVRFIFASFLAGNSLRAVAADLSAKGIEKPAGGSRWWAGSVRDLITNPAYCGRTVIFRQKKLTRYVKGERVLTTKRTAEDEHMELPADTTPAIVSETDFERVQNLLKENRQTKRRAPRREFLLRGLITCGNCGRKHSSEIMNGWRGYVCTSKQDRALNCKTRALSAKKAEAAVWQVVTEILSDGRKLKKLFQISKGEKARKQTAADAINKINSQISKIDAEIAALVRRAETVDDELWIVFSKRIEEKRHDREKLKQQLQAESMNLESSRAGEFDIESKLTRLKEIVPYLETLDFEKRVALLELLDISCEWDGGKLTIKGLNTILW